ncbi:MAG: hypothetical protein E6Q88_14535 [Lysobacteraceae bacterium]|nr:MAG: hypothetical protein E6Q88_14535 [Xanthomonadaceae bacterium]
MFSNSSDSKPGATDSGRSTPPSKAQLALDNLLRRELRVGDPRNPQQIAKALLDRYQAEPRARGIQSEAEGLPFLRSAPRFVQAAPDNTATSVDLKQAMSDVEKDLENLNRNNLLKDIDAELGGWSDGIRSSAQEGVNAARFGLDPRNRDRAIGMRRTLGDYARLSRLVGALNPSATYEFRSLAQSIDEVCAVILVMLGESMANNGFAGGRFLLQAPFTEMQTRRDACIHSLQNLLGSLSYQNAPNEWPRGIDAYRRLFDALEAQGQGDLRALMTEPELMRVLDDLVRRAAHGSAEGLRALGSTAQIELNRVYRLINFGYRLVDPESPPLTSFLEALRLFADGFGQAGGSRLLRVARPPIVFYGLYGIEEEAAADRRIVNLTVARGRLASQVDCLARCACDDISCQVMLDKILYDIDRTIDLYAVGSDDLGLPEIRAASYSYLIDAFLHLESNEIDPQTGQNLMFCPDLPAALVTTLEEIAEELRPHSDAEPDWDTTLTRFEQRRTTNEAVAGSTFRFTDILHQELCLQLQSERRWEALADQMSANCIPMSTLFGDDGALVVMLENAMQLVVDGIAANVVNTDCGLDGPDIPAHFETSLDTIAQDRLRFGGSPASQP